MARGLARVLCHDVEFVAFDEHVHDVLLREQLAEEP